MVVIIPNAHFFKIDVHLFSTRNEEKHKGNFSAVIVRVGMAHFAVCI